MCLLGCWLARCLLVMFAWWSMCFLDEQFVFHETWNMKRGTAYYRVGQKKRSGTRGKFDLCRPSVSYGHERGHMATSGQSKQEGCADNRLANYMFF